MNVISHYQEGHQQHQPEAIDDLMMASSCLTTASHDHDDNAMTTTVIPDPIANATTSTTVDDSVTPTTTTINTDEEMTTIDNDDIDTSSASAEFQQWLHAAHDQHDATAQYHLGLALAHAPTAAAHGVAPHDALALRYWQAAAAQGHAGALYQWAWCYEAGALGLPCDRAAAVALMTRAAALQCPHAQCYLGWCHFNGEGGLIQDQAKGVALFHLAAAQNLAEAQFHLGNCYKAGEGVPAVDLPRSIAYYQQAARQRHAGAQNNLGNRYYHGQGVPRDLYKAVEWCTASAAQGNEYGMATVGECYRDGGPGLPQDLYVALQWFRKAYEHGYEPALAEIGALEGKLQRQVQTLPGIKLRRNLNDDNGNGSTTMANTMAKCTFAQSVEECPCCFEPFTPSSQQSSSSSLSTPQQQQQRPRIMIPSCGHCYCYECLHAMCQMTAQQKEQERQQQNGTTASSTIITTTPLSHKEGNCAMCRRGFRLKNVKRVVLT